MYSTSGLVLHFYCCRVRYLVLDHNIYKYAYWYSRDRRDRLQQVPVNVHIYQKDLKSVVLRRYSTVVTASSRPVGDPVNIK
jgi:hypothetical protein